MHKKGWLRKRISLSDSLEVYLLIASSVFGSLTGVLGSGDKGNLEQTKGFIPSRASAVYLAEGEGEEGHSAEEPNSLESLDGSTEYISSLAELVGKPSGEDYTGFRELLKECGFQFMELKYKATLKKEDVARDVVFLGTLPMSDDKVNSNLVKIVDYLIKEHGFDSIGLPLVYGPPRKNMELELRREFYDFTWGLNWFGDHNREMPSFETQKNFLINVELPDSLRKYARQESVPAYGIDDKMVSFESFCINGSLMCINSLLKFIAASREKSGEEISYAQIHGTEQHEGFVHFVMHKFPKLPYPGKDFGEIIDNLSRGEGSLRGVYERLFVVSYIEGGIAISNNIQKCMKELGSKKTVVLIDFPRLLHKEYLTQITDNMIGPDYKIPDSYIPVFKRLPSPYCYLMCANFGIQEKGG